MAIGLKRGRVVVRIDGPVADGIEKELRDLLGPIITELEWRADVVLAKVRTEWPRGYRRDPDKPRSRGGIDEITGKWVAGKSDWRDRAPLQGYPHSADQWKKAIRLQESQFKVWVSLVNDAKDPRGRSYVQYIESAKVADRFPAGKALSRKRHSLSWLVRQPMKEHRKDSKKQIRRIVAKWLKESLDG